MLRKREHTKYLGIQVSLDTFRRMIEISREHDINRGGLWDARSGVVNFWCSPENKPECWGEVTQGGLDYPRDYVGGLYYDHDKGELYLQVTPFSRPNFQQGPPQFNKKPNELTDEQWDQCVAWCENQAQVLIKKATG